MHGAVADSWNSWYEPSSAGQFVQSPSAIPDTLTVHLSGVSLRQFIQSIEWLDSPRLLISDTERSDDELDDMDTEADVDDMSDDVELSDDEFDDSLELDEDDSDALHVEDDELDEPDDDRLDDDELLEFDDDELSQQMLITCSSSAAHSRASSSLTHKSAVGIVTYAPS